MKFLSTFTLFLSTALASPLLSRQVGGGKLLGTSIAVKSHDASVAFYKALGATVEKRTYKNATTFQETVLNFPSSGAQDLSITQWADGRAKAAGANVALSIFTTDTAALEAKIAGAGGKVVSAAAGTTAGVSTDLDGWKLEINNVANLGVPTAAQTVFAATVLGYADVAAALAYYTGPIGLTVQRAIPPDRQVLDFSAKVSAIVIQGGGLGGAAAAPIKLSVGVTDPTAFAALLAANGGTIALPPAPNAEVGGLTYGYARDRFGYLWELRKLSEA